MKNKYAEFISELFLFKGLSDEIKENVICKYDFYLEEFSKGDVIFSPDKFQKKIGFVTSGECRVERLREEGDHVFLNTLRRFDSFGIIAALSEDNEYPTRIIASKNASVLFIDGNDLIEIIKEVPEISLNVISFLTSKISFLNKKIATFSGKSTAQKLSSYLLEKFRLHGSLAIKVSRTTLASELGIGRASVYRDLDLLEKRGLIEIQQKEIIIKCPEGLERI